ncbi:MAG: AbrB/MazE/SpoVT family DNA-binding domain-containing protein [Planctomycetes bacterium]|nr:AbrB/MazE/SpoVT family DNA-binding domain-containing protein [Planctomycetota bacterium]
MIKKLTKHGNSLALVIDRSILDLLEIDADTPISMTTDGKHLVIAKATGAKVQRRLEAILEKGNKKYARMFKRLAD